jgi:hypothetical protein
VFGCSRRQAKLRQVTLGDRRWRAILGDVRGMARLKVYMDKHNGAIPPLMSSLGGGGGGGGGKGGKGGGGGSFVTRLRSLVGAREDPNIRYRILLNKRRWRDEAVQTQHEYILADKASIQYANAPPGPTSLAQAAHMDDDAKHDPYALIDNDSDDSDFDEGAGGRGGRKAGTLSTQRLARTHGEGDGRLATREERRAYEKTSTG